MNKKDKKSSTIIVSIIVMLVCTFFYSCSGNQKERKLKEDSKAQIEKQKVLNKKYVYVDVKGVMHNDRSCIKLLLGEDNKIGVNGIRRVNKMNIPDSLFDKCCSECITDSVYDYLKDINRENNN